MEAATVQNPEFRKAVIRLLSRGNSYLAEEIGRFTKREDAFLAVVVYLAAGGSPGLLGLRSSSFERYASFADVAARAKALETARLYGPDTWGDVMAMMWPEEAPW